MQNNSETVTQGAVFSDHLQVCCDGIGLQHVSERV